MSELKVQLAAGIDKERALALQVEQLQKSRDLLGERPDAGDARDPAFEKVLAERRALQEELEEAKRSVDQHKRVLVTLQAERDDAVQISAAWRRRAKVCVSPQY